MKQGKPAPTLVDPRPVEPTVIIPLPPPPEEHYHLLLWTMIPLKPIELKSLERHLQRRLRIVDREGCMILIENLRRDTFPRMHFASNEYVLNEYRAADLPFYPIPEPLSF